MSLSWKKQSQFSNLENKVESPNIYGDLEKLKENEAKIRLEKDEQEQKTEIPSLESKMKDVVVSEHMTFVIEASLEELDKNEEKRCFYLDTNEIRLRCAKEALKTKKEEEIQTLAERGNMALVRLDIFEIDSEFPVDLALVCDQIKDMGAIYKNGQFIISGVPVSALNKSSYTRKYNLECHEKIKGNEEMHLKYKADMKVLSTCTETTLKQGGIYHPKDKTGKEMAFYNFYRNTNYFLKKLDHFKKEFGLKEEALKYDKHGIIKVQEDTLLKYITDLLKNKKNYPVNERLKVEIVKQSKSKRFTDEKDLVLSEEDKQNENLVNALKTKKFKITINAKPYFMIMDSVEENETEN